MNQTATFGSKNWIPVFMGMTREEWDCFTAEDGSQNEANKQTFLLHLFRLTKNRQTMPKQAKYF